MKHDNVFWKIVHGELPMPGAAATLGWKFVAYDEDKNQMQIEFDAGNTLTNPLGHIQGGMLSAMLDDCLGPAVYARLPLDQIAVTVESITKFVSPARPGRILGMGQMDRVEGETLFASGTLTDEKGKVLATATSTFLIRTVDVQALAAAGRAAKM